MLTLPQPIAAQIHAHAERDYPHECCGVLLGSFANGRWSIAAALPAANSEAQSPQNRYSIDARELVRIHREAARQGLDIAGFYHSHPDHPAMWSPTDLAEAHWLGCLYLITELRAGKAVTTNAFLLAGNSEEEKHFLPVAIEPTS
ncbi:MAG TPA: M67 family metallopeptidase [Acidobacteriaceae bacterium]|nr:M67 family metallopeptidase [Acidobacteriaceae bacterium]